MDQGTFKSFALLKEAPVWGESDYNDACLLLCPDEDKRKNFCSNLNVLVKNNVQLLPKCDDETESKIFGHECCDVNKAAVIFNCDGDFLDLSKSFMPSYMGLIEDKNVCGKLISFYGNPSTKATELQDENDLHMYMGATKKGKKVIKFNWYAYCLIRSMFYLRRHAEAAIAREEHAPFTQAFVSMFENSDVRDGVSKGLAPVVAELMLAMESRLIEKMEAAVFQANLNSTAKIVEALKSSRR
jgi:hypothetical protein